MLAQCRARIKFLILDCCHAGAAKGPAKAEVDAELLAKDIVRERVGGCVVLASCRAEERSYEWPERQQSIFTYWLCNCRPTRTTRKPIKPSC